MSRVLAAALCLGLIAPWGAWAAKDDPKVKLEEPERGERRFVAPAAIPIEARAEAARGRTIVKVEFFADDQPIGEASAEPYAMVWTGVPEGRYELRARATDDQGASDWSPKIKVRVHENREPRVRLTSPRPKDRYEAPASIELEAKARDRDDNLVRVEFYANGVLLGTDAASRFRFSWTGVAAGTYNVWARAVDALGATDDSRTVTIVVAGNQAPSVALSSPAAGAVFQAPASITLSAQAADADGSVAQVEFFANGASIGVDTSAPYSVAWSNVAVGNYSLSARVTDNLGAQSTSAAVPVIVNAGNQAPSVALSSPAAGAVFLAPASITLTAEAADTDGTVSQVEFFANGTSLGVAPSAPYSVAWSNVAAGSYSLTARVTDNLGGQTTSAAVPVTVNAGPSVSLTAPAAGAVFNAPASITLTADASDPDGSVAKLEFFDGTTLVATVSAPPYTKTVNNVQAGSHSFTARVTDNLGGQTTSAAVLVTVNAGPSVSLTTPGTGAVFNAPASITLTAEAADADGSVASVEFYQGTTLITTLSAAPYTFIWTNVPQGTYALSARATDDRGATTASAAVSVTVEVVRAQQMYFIHTDHLNTPRLVADSTGTTVWRWDQAEPFGSNPADEDPDANSVAFDLPLRLPGQRYDAETGLHYNYFRDYDPIVGRYVASDPLGIAGGLNSFSYAIADPLRFADPVGLTVFLFRMTLGGGVSASAFGGQVFNLQVSDPVAGQTCNYTVACFGIGLGVRGSVSGGSGTVSWDDGKQCSNCRQFEGDGSMGVIAAQIGPIGYTPVQWIQVPGGPRLDFSGWAVAEINVGGGTFACRFYLR